MHKFWVHLRNLRLEHLWKNRNTKRGANEAVRASLKPLRLLALEDRLLFDASPIAADDPQAEPISIERLVELFDNPSDAALVDLFSLTALPGPDVSPSELHDLVHELSQFSASVRSSDSQESTTLSIFSSEIVSETMVSPDFSTLFDSSEIVFPLPELPAHLATNLIVLDSQVTGMDELLADLRAQQGRGRNLEVLILDPTRNGIDQITEAMSRFDRLDSLQIVSHGNAAGLHLGGVWLDESRLAANAASFRQWQDVLSADADIVLYGCNLASSQGGRDLLSALASATGADVAASDDLTGHASLGGDWDLEFQSGSIESASAFTHDIQANWYGTLATVTVTNVLNVANGNTSSISALIAADGGDGISLMEAIMAANNTGAADTINFNIAGAGPHTIIVTSALPTITNQVTIDGSSEPDWSTNGNRPIVILDGNNLAADGLVLTASADGSIIRGLVIRDFGGDGIEIQANSNGNTIAGNYIGQLNTSGTDAGASETNSGAGINVLGANNTIGGLTTADRNVLSGNTGHGILITGAGATGNTVAGNYVGLTASGSIGLGNGIDGIAIVSASGNTIGGVTAMHQNVISANTDDGVQIQDGDNNIVEGNRIGTNNSGIVNLGNLDDGIAIDTDSDSNQVISNQISGNSSSGIDVGAVGLDSSGNIFRGNLIGTAADGVTNLGNTLHGLWLGNGLTATGTIIGGTLLGQGNTIAWNGGDGVYVQSSTGVSILGNSIFSNSQQGIDVGTNGVTNNDLNDSDGGANNQQNFPVLQAAVVSNGQIILSGTLNSEANKTYRIEFFANTSNDIEGQRFLGFTTVTTPASTPYTTSFNVTLNATVAEGEFITATATDPSGNTSEFSATYRARGTSGLWLSSTTSGTAGGVTWDNNRIAQFGDPSLSFEPGTTSGTLYATEFDLSNFGSGVGNLNGLHYVSRTVTVGSANAVTLLPGDVLFSTAQNETLGGVGINSRDIALFRPTTSGNYSNGTFSVLLQNPLGSATRDFALVELSTVVGGVTLNAGDFLLTAANPGLSQDITRYQVVDVGPGTTSGTSSELIDGGSAGIGFANDIYGVELVQTSTTLGGAALSAGQLLISLSAADVVGTNNLSVTQFDVFALTVTATGTGTSSGTATLLVQGSDIGLTVAGEEYDAIALLPLNQAPVLDSSKSPTLTTINEDAGAPVGAVGTLVSALVDFSSPIGQVDNVTDFDGSALLGIAITAADTSNGTWHYSIDGGSNWNTLGAVTGSAAQLLAADANSRLYFQPTANYNGTISNAITFRAWDRTIGTNGSTASTSANGGANAFSTATDSASLTINAVNDQAAFTALNGTPTFIEGGSAVVLDSNVTIFDTELTAANNFGGATLTLVRNGGANVQDAFSATGTLAALTQGANLIVGGTTVGSVTTNSSGTLVLTFNANATNSLVNSVMQRIAYSNSSDTPSATAQINWTFNDKNSGAQGTGGALNATGSTTVTITATNDAPTFSIGDGIVITDFASSDDSGYSVTAQADGKVLVAGYIYNGVNYDFALVRYNTDGSLDTSFSGDGKLTTAIGSFDDFGYNVFVQADGKILVAGLSDDGINIDFALVRYNTDGTLDTSFSGDGKLTTAIGLSNDLGYSIAVQADGKILLAGYSDNGVNYDFALVRYNTDGTLDTSFSGDGKLTTAVGSSTDLGYSVTVQIDGKILLAGFSDNGVNYDFALVRYNSDGTLDTSFSGDGKLTTAIGSNDDQGNHVTVQADGKILLAGSSFNGANDDFALVRYNADGTLDTSFSGDGKLTTAIGSNDDLGYSVSVQADGKILVAGYIFNGVNYDVALVRYNADGTLDTSFSGDGKLTTAIGLSNDLGFSVAIQVDGKILLAGSSDNGSNDDFALVRYNADGTLDTRFEPLNTLDGAPTFTEGGAAVVLDANVQVFDAELSAANNFNGAMLTLVRNGGASAQDVYSATGTLSALTQGGSLVVGGTTIGTVTTNSSGTLVLTFNANATNALVNSAMQQIAYRNNSDTPPATAQINWTINDGNSGAQGTGGALTTTGSTTVSITATNDAPVTTTSGGTTAYVENANPLIVDTTLTITDVDSSDFNGGSLTITISASGSSNDRIVIVPGGAVTVLGTGVYYSGTLVGTTSGGVGTAPLIITFNANSTPAIAQDVGRHVGYFNVSDNPSTVTRTIDFVVTDGDGGTSNTSQKLVSMTAVADAPIAVHDHHGLRFDGIDDYVNMGSNTSLVVTNTFTVETWVRPTAYPVATGIILNKEGEYEVGIDSTGKLRWAVSNTNPSWNWHDTGYTLALNQWAHVSVAYNNGVVNTYVNGNLVETYFGSGAIGDTYTLLNDFRVGGRSNNPTNQYFSGDIDEVRLWNTARTQTEVRTNLDQSLVGNETGLIGYWKFNEGSGSTTIDSVTANSNTGTLVDGGAGTAGPQWTGYTTNQNTQVSVSIANGILANDLDGEGNLLTISQVNGSVANVGTQITLASGAKVTVGTQGDYLYDPNGAFNYLDAGQSSTDSFTYQVSDGTGNFDTATVTLRITGLNDAPTNASIDNNAVAENAANGTVVGTVSGTDPDSGALLNYTLIDSAGGRFAINLASGVLTVANGSLLDREAAASHNVSVRVTDLGGQTYDKILTINLNDVDEFDVTNPADMNAAANAVNENAASGTTVGITAYASDADATTNTITYSLSNNDGGRFTIDANTGVVTVNGAINRETDGASRNITVRATSADTSFTDQVFTINITDVDEFDTGAVTDTNAAANSVAENAANGTVVGITALASDADATTNTITYSLSNNDGGRFTIDANTGVVTVNGAINRETDGASRNITVRATSADTSFTDQVFTINITDVDEFDTGAVADSNATANSVAENAAIGTVVNITALASDADATTNTITYSLSNNDGGRFTIDANTGVVTVNGAINRETDGSSRNITVRATSADTSFTDQVFTINITDVDEFDVTNPVDVNAAANAVNENAANGTVVGITANASDSDATNSTVTYMLTDNAGGRFAIDGNTGVVTVADGTLLNRELAASHNITVRATSTDTSVADTVFTININDVDEFDVGPVIDTNAAVNTVAENATIGTPVGVVASAQDLDATNNTITYTLDDDAGGLFAIDGVTGVVTVSGTLDYEAVTSHNISVRATSSDGSSNTQMFTINVTDVNESPVTAISDTDVAANFVMENVSIGTTVGVTAFADDLDVTDTVSYSLDDDAGGLFAIDSTTGVVTVVGAIDRETAASYNITARATSTDTSATVRVFSIAIGDLDEFDVSVPTDTDAGVNEVDENVIVGTTVGLTANAFDLDATNNTITYSLTSNPGGLFLIDPNTGVVTTALAIDLETHGASRSITVQAASSDGSVQSQVFNITINDLDEFDVSVPTDTDAAANQVDENVIVGTAVGLTANAFDLDATNNSITYTLTSNPGGLFQIDVNTGVVRTAAAIDREPLGAVRSITVQAASSDGSTQTQTFNIMINDLDEFNVGAVTDSNTSTNSVAENASVGTVVGITAFAQDLDATSNAITYTLDDNASGRFTIDSVTGVVTVTGALDYETAISHSITVRASSSDGSFSTQVFTINVTDANESAVTAISDTDMAVDFVMENVSVGTVVGVTALADDLDGSDTVSYSLDDDAGGLFAIDSTTGVVTVVGAINRETAANYNITIRANSTDTSTTARVFSIAIGDVDEFDVSNPADVNAAANAVNESAVNGSTVGIAAFSSDADATTNTVTYSLFDNAGGRFAIDASTGVVTVADGTLLNREAAASHSITVRATSADGSTADTVFTINLNDLDEFDVGAVTDSNVTANDVAENASVGTAVGLTAFASDADATTNAIAYSMDDNASGRFAIDGVTGVMTVVGSLDYETLTSHVVTVRATSADGSFSTQVFTINVTNVNEASVSAVTDIDGAADTVAENSAVGTAVGVTAKAIDADTIDTVTYSLDDTAGGRFAIDANTGIVTVAGTLDREAAGSYSITIRAASSDMSFTTTTLSINISDIDEFDVSAPVDANVAANTITENAANGTVVGITANASDIDATNNTVTYSLTDNAGGRFAIDANTGVVTVADGTLLNREAAASHNIIIRAISADGSTADSIFTVNLSDVDEFDVTAPVDGNNGNNEIDENAASGAVVGVTASASDADATTNTITYSLTDSAAGRFAIDVVTGVVTVADGTLLNREVIASHNITVRATSADGSTADSVVTINVNDVDEFDVGAVSDANAAVNSVAENAGVGTTVGLTAFASDADATNNAIAYSLDDSAGGRFAIDGLTGVVTVVGGLDYEFATSHVVTVRAASADGSFQVQSFTIGVTPVNDNSPVIISNGGGAIAAVSVAENQSAVTTVSATDVDVPSQSLTFSIVSGADSGLFAINSSTGELTFVAPPDFETFADSNGDGVYEVVVQASDGGLIDQQSIFVTVTNANESPTSIVPSVFNVDENTQTGAGYSVGVLSATDPDASDTKSFSIVGGTDSLKFSIGGVNGNELVVTDGVLDFELQSSYQVIVRVSDGGGLSYDKTIAVNVNNLNDSPTAITPITLLVDENIDTSGGWNLGGLLATDQDAGDSFTFAIFGGADALKFSLGGLGGNSLVLDDGQLNFERQDSYEVIVRVTDAGGLTHDETIRVSVRDLNEAPTNVLPSVFTVAENTDTSAGLSLGQFVATDEDIGDTFTYSIIGGPDAARFTMGGLAGDELIFSAGVLNFEVKSSYSVLVRVIDGGGLSYNTTVVVAVINVNENPMATSDLFGVAEEQLLSGNVLANDVDPDNDSLTAQLVSGPANAASFQLNANGTFTYTPSTNYFGTDSFTYRAGDGSLDSSLITVTISISNVNDGPIGVADRYILPADLQTIIVNSVTANDIDVDNPTLVAILVRQPLFGDFQFNSNGTFTYKPFGGFVGTDSFAYRPTDGIATGAEILVQLEVVSAGTQNSHTGVVTLAIADTIKELPRHTETTTKSITMLSDSEPNAGRLVDILASSNPINNEINSGVMDTDISSQLSAGLRMGDEDRAASILDFILSVSQTLNRTVGNEQADALLRNGLSLIFNMQRMSEQLDSLGESVSKERRGLTTAEMGFAISTVSMTAGYLIWSLRGGMLLATFVTSLPSWQWIDPLPILESYPESARKQSKEELDRFFHDAPRRN